MLLRSSARLLRRKQQHLPSKPSSTHRLLLLLRKMSSAAVLLGPHHSSGRLGRLMQSPFSRTELYNATTGDSFMSHGKKSKKKKTSSKSKTKLRKVSTKSPSSSSSKKTKQATSTHPSYVRSFPATSTLVGVDSGSPVSKRHNYSSSASFLRPHPQATLKSHSHAEYGGPSKVLLSLNPAQPRSAISIRLSPSVGTRFLSYGRNQGPARSEFTIERLAHDLAKMKFKKIIVMTGAGISTSSGIPDFR